jgi:hypothetical protein
MSPKAESKYVAEYWEKMLKRQFEAGDKSVLLYAVYQCLEMKRPLPEWARIAFLDVCEAVERFEIKSWDDAFGRPFPKSTHLKAEKRKEQLRWTIMAHVKNLKAEGGRIDKELFDKIGWRLNPKLSGTTVSKIYYDPRSHEIRRNLSPPGLGLQVPRRTRK